MIRVVKVGGSLFDCDGLVDRLQQWLAAQKPGFQVLVAGGGTLADVIRMADGRFSLDDEQAHWLAVEALGITAKLLHAILPGAQLAYCLEDLDSLSANPETSGAQPLAVLEPQQFMREVEPNLEGCQLPHGWQVTSDSIAARIAQALRADELVLLKSGLPPLETTREAASAEGYVDAFFPLASQELRAIRCVDFHNDECAEVLL